MVITPKVFAFCFGTGSSNVSWTRLETVGAGAAPAAIVNLDIDPNLTLDSILGDESNSVSQGVWSPPQDEVIGPLAGDKK